MCGVMKSLASAIIFEQQWFGHHRQKEKRHQAYQRRLDRDIRDPRQRGVQHQNEESERRSYRPADQQLTGRAASRSSRSQQRVGAELYCESQSSRNEHRIVLVNCPVVAPQDDRRDDDEGGGDSSEKSERPLLPHRFLRRSSSSRSCAAEILRYML